MSSSSQSSRNRSIAGTILIFLPGLALGMFSILKFAGVPGVVHKMALAGFGGGKLTLVAALELASAILFLYHQTRSFGLLFLSAFLGGAICTHVQMGEPLQGVGPAILLALAWIGTWLRHPEMLWSFKRSTRSLGGEDVEGGLASREA
jgi:DoxX-like protein